MTKRAIVLRMLQNLRGLAEKAEDRVAVLRYLDTILAISPTGVAERFERAMLRWQSGEREGAKEDVDWLLAHQPDGVDVERLRDFREMLERASQ